jgi:hypothetical protein
MFSVVVMALILAPLGADALLCAPGTFYWVSEGIERCAQCLPGCACPGNYTPCLGCSSGTYSAAAGATTCTACPEGTTTDSIYNAGCDPENFLTPCANGLGPLGFAACHPNPPAPRTAFAMPTGALQVPPQYLAGGPPPVPNVVPPYYDDTDKPFLQQSY